MQATARRLSVVSATSCARRRLIRNVRQQMKRIFQLIGLAVTLSPVVVKASQPTLTSISQPLYFIGSSSDAVIEIIETPKILNNSSAMAWIELFSSPTEVPGSGGDLNLISLYGLSVKIVSQDKDGRVTEIGVDTSTAKQPKRYPFTINDVTEATIKAIRSEFPDAAATKISVVRGDGASPSNKIGEQDSSGQPATAPESKSEGKDKPQPESKVAPQ